MSEDIRPLTWSYSSDPVFADKKLPVIAGMLNRGEVAILSAAPFSGKSLIAAHMCVMICAGQSFFGREVRQGQALYIAGERELETRRRIGAMIAPHSDIDVPVAGHMSSGRIDLREENGAARVIETIRELERQVDTSVQLVVIDTMSRVAPGMDENSSRDVGVLVDALADIAAAGPAVLVLHHPSKSGNGPRGSTALVGAADAVLEITSGRNGIKTLRLAESNSGPAGASVRFELKSATYTHTSTGEITETFVPVQVEMDVNESRSSITGDAKIALEVLKAMGPGAHLVDTWKKATYRAFGTREQAAKRMAWGRALQKTEGLDLVEIVDGSAALK